MPWSICTRVYFLRVHGFVKIGAAHQPLTRMEELQAGCPYPMTLLLVLDGNRTMENRLHKAFSHLRVHREWFRLQGTLEVFVGKANAADGNYMSALREAEDARPLRRRKQPRPSRQEVRKAHQGLLYPFDYAQKVGIDVREAWEWRRQAGMEGPLSFEQWRSITPEEKRSC